MKKQLITFLAALIVIIVIFGTIYAAVQQSQRSDANYPQIQMAEDMATQIKDGGGPYGASTLSPVDMGASLAPFTIVYDSKGKVVSGSGYLNGEVPKASLGMLEASKGKDYNAVTWQPASNTRIAAVIVYAPVTKAKANPKTAKPIQAYYVLSGRSLTEVEKNENQTLLIAAAGCVLSLLIAIGAFYSKQLAAIRL